MCCAHIKYVFKQDSQDFHACASRIGIENSRGQISDSLGFRGTWKCDGANAMLVTALIIASLSATL
jgi:hypothetical protein